MKIVITGSTGFIGQALIRYLRDIKGDHQIQTLDRNKHSLQDKASLLSLFRNCDLVFHLAAVNNKDDPNLFTTNVLGTINVLEAINEVADPSCKIIFTSSFSVYKLPKKNEIITERFTTHPSNKYGLSKLISEKILELYSQNSNKKIVILRISNPYGPKMTPYKHSVVATFFAKALEDKPLVIHGKGTQTRDFIYIDDVVAALWKSAITSLPSPFSIINVCSGTQTSIESLIRIIEECLKKKLKVVYKTQKKESGFWKGDNSFARKMLNWKPTIDIQRGIQIYCQQLL
ncbi:MAG: NAD(P)-dependent oxidoreductase [Candidatus Levybacteria bacterium]|nr:NAD(P)-dependent oxidoreductase [Candidatus Levybacteria bacterium]